MPTAAPSLFEPVRPRLQWVAPPPPDPRAVEALAASLRLPAALCRMLVQRGHSDADRARRFLRPRREHLHSHGLLAGIGDATERVVRAIRKGETILVHGDYDVDGVCGTAILVRALTLMGGRAVPFVPHRVDDGYDLTIAGIDAATTAGATLIITADCGIVAHSGVRTAHERGIDVVVTDHHTPADTLPSAIAVINPNRADCGYPEKGLAGAGVAFKLAQAVAGRLGIPEERLTPLVDLVAVATIADLAPLTAENRALVRWGLSILVRTPNVGMRALLASAGLADRGEITAGQVGFVLAPRINAVGRVGNAMSAVRLLLTEDAGEAERLANLHELENRRRRELDESTLADAMKLLESTFDPARDRGVVLASESWHPGVIGIVASRIVEQIHRPTVLIALAGAEGKGSGRSIPGFHLQQAFVACAEHLDRFGGHRAAAGCSLRADRVDAFRAAFDAHARANLTEDGLVPAIRVDGELDLADASAELIGLLRHFAPFGIGNPTPVFAAYGVTLDTPRVVGRNHLKTTLREGDSRLEAIGFDMAPRLAELSTSRERFDAAFKLEENEWTGRDGRVRRTVQAWLVDVRPAA